MKAKAYKPTAQQEAAATAARSYLRSHVGIDEDEVNDEKRCIEIIASDRDSAGDDEPSARIIEEMEDHVKALRALSPLIHVSTEYIDEWVHLRVRVKETPRKDRATLAEDLSDSILQRLPESISKHPKTRRAGLDYSREFVGIVSVLTEVASPYGKRSVRLVWQLDGNTTAGWKLRVQWGEHTITRPAKFKKLTSVIVLAQFDKLLAQMSDPLDAMGWTIHTLTDGKYATNFSRRARDTSALYNVSDKARTTVAPCRQCTHVEFTNNYSGKTIMTAVGDPLPQEVIPITVEE